jgi:thiol-disulfide isomerase/thioredoxin
MDDLTIEALVDGGLLVEGSGEQYALSGGFVEDVEASNDAIRTDDGGDPFAESSGAETAMRHVVDDDPGLVSKYLAVDRRMPETSFEETLNAVFVLDQFIDPRPKTAGVPDGFLPIRCEHLEAAVNLYRRAIVYCWREECEPCDVMKEDFETVFDTAPDDVALFAVYGPDCAVSLQRRFDVEGAPTVLFFVDGSVDFRLTGGQYLDTLESEIDRFRNVSSP